MKQNLLLVILVSLFCSCQKEITTEGPNANTNPNTNTSQQVDVYVAGFVSDDANYHYPYYDPFYPYPSGEHPTYWKNGSPVQLDYGDYRGDDNIKSGRARAIAVSGNNVYVTGYGTWLSYTVGTLPYGSFWKNGLPVNSMSSLFETDELRSLAVSNNVAYMVGWGAAPNATYYKNGSMINLSPNAPDYSLATSITVSGNDVYVAGISFNRNYYNGGYNRMAKYWKNINPVNLTNGSKDAFTNSIAVSGTDVYVAGEEHNGSAWIAKYWKNGQATTLTDGPNDAFAESIAVVGSDVYVAGTQWDGNSIQYNNGINGYHRNPIAKYWKNGKPVNLTDGSKWAEAKSIAVSGNDVYVAGFEDAVAKYWKNGIPVILGDVSKNSEAYSIFLAPK